MRCRPRGLRLALAGCLILTVSACSREPEQTGVRRIAVLPFENLSGDPQLDWIGRAVPLAVNNQLATAPDLTVQTADSVVSVPGLRAAEVVHGYYSSERGPLRLVAVVRDPQTNRTLRQFQTEGKPAEVLALLDALSRHLWPDVPPFPTRNSEAFRRFVEASGETAPERAVEGMRAAAASDASFSLPRISLARLLLTGGDVEGARAELKALQAASLAPHLRSWVDFLSATADGDEQGKLRSLRELVKLAPTNLDAWRTLAQLEQARRDFHSAAAALEQALILDPADQQALNSLAYVHAFTGNLDGARAAVERYRAAAPGDANPSDTWGDVLFQLGRFEEAEQAYLEAHRLNPSLLAGGDLYRAALARLYRGDVRGADQLFVRFLEHRRSLQDAVLPLREAVWEASTGRLEQGSTRLAQLAARTDVPLDVRNAAAAQWSIFGGGPLKLAGPPGNPAVRNLALLAALLTAPSASPEEWQRRAAQFGPPAIGYALLRGGHFAAAVPVWERLYRASLPDSDSDPRVMLAWAYAQTGRAAEARKLLERRPIPPRMPEPGLAYLTTAKDLELRPRL